MADFRHDQAAGLRRLFGQSTLRVLTFASGSAGVGKTSVVVNIAVALARQGLEVLIVDENSGTKNIGTFFGLHPQGDLLQVLDRQRRLEHVIYSPLPGVQVLPAARVARKLGILSQVQQQALLEGVAILERPVDIILVDSTQAHDHGFSPWGLAGEAVIVVSGNSTSITDAYALIKKISMSAARRRFRILVNRVRNLEEGQVIYNNLHKVSIQRGVAHLEYGGAVPADNNLRQSARLYQPVVVALPDTPSSQAFREVAMNMLHWPEAEYENGGLEQFVQQLLHLSHPITPKVMQA